MEFLESTMKRGTGRWRARLISEGQGSSGFYPRETLKTFGPKAWPKGTHIFFNHLTESEDWERRGSHDIKDLIGVVDSDPEFNEEDGGLYADIKIFEKDAEFVEQVAPYVGLSIEAGGEIIEGRVVALEESPMNAVTLVPRAGRDGKLTQMIESHRTSGRMTLVEDAQASEESDAELPERNPMTEEEKAALVEAVATAVSAAVVEALKPTEPEGEETDAVDEAAVVESALAAGLGASARKRVVEAVRAGTKPEDAIASEKAIRDEVLAEAQAKAEGGVTVKEGATSTFRPKTW